MVSHAKYTRGHKIKYVNGNNVHGAHIEDEVKYVLKCLKGGGFCRYC